jgi:hypothetical protein
MTVRKSGRPAAGYPKPDRSRFVPNRVKTEANDTLDIGWAEGIMRDGRPWRAEAWCQDQVTFLTFFFSSLGLGRATDADLAARLTAEDLVTFVDEDGQVEGRRAKDDAGQRVWEVVVVVGDDDELYVSSSPKLRPYPMTGTGSGR